MTATLDDTLRALRAEKAAPPPRPWHNPRRDYAAEIEALRAARRGHIERARKVLERATT